MAMTMILHTPAMSDGGARQRLSRLLAVVVAIYGLLALLTGAAAAAGLFGLAGLEADPGAAGAARLLGLPWSLAMSSAEAQRPAATLLLSLGGLTLNILILMAAAGLARGRRRRA